MSDASPTREFASTAPEQNFDFCSLCNINSTDTHLSFAAICLRNNALNGGEEGINL